MFACVVDRPRDPVICLLAVQTEGRMSSPHYWYAALWRVAITAGEAFGTIAEAKDRAEDRTLGFWMKSCDINL